MRHPSGSERGSAAGATLPTFIPPAQIVLQESDDEDDDPPVLVSTQLVTQVVKQATIPSPVIAEPPAGFQSPQDLQSQASELDSDEFEVETIIQHRSSGSKKKPTMEYYVKWKGYPDSENTWEPEGNFHEALIREYWSKQPSNSKSKKKRRLSSLLSGFDDDDDDERDQVDLSRELSEEITSTPKASSKRKAQQDSPSKSNSSRKSQQASPPRKHKKRTRLSGGGVSNDDNDDDPSYHDEDDSVTETTRYDEEPTRHEAGKEQPEQDLQIDERKAFMIQQVKAKLLQHYRDRFHRWETVVLSCVDMMRDDEEGIMRSLLEFGEPHKYAKALKHVGLDVDDDTGVNARIWVDNITANERCPQKMIKFYEAHIKFSRPS